MRLTRDESRALAFIALLLALAAVARVARRDPAVRFDAPAIDVDTLAAAAHAARAEAERRSRPLAEGERIDPNTAPPAELDRLPGIGAVVADRIVEERDREGAYRSVADLAERVAGIGEKTARRLAPLLTLAGSPPADIGLRHRPPRADSVLLDDVDGPDGTREGEPEATVDLNRASAADLERLPGIGPVLARRILAYRDSVGGFGSVDEIERVSGIGPRTLARLRPRLRAQP